MTYWSRHRWLQRARGGEVFLNADVGQAPPGQQYGQQYADATQHYQQHGYGFQPPGMMAGILAPGAPPPPPLVVPFMFVSDPRQGCQMA